MSHSRPATPYHCPFCADEDLRPVPEPPDGWVCRSCARVFTVSFVRLDAASLPAAPHPAQVEHPRTAEAGGAR